MKNILFLFILLPLSGIGQHAYKNNFTQGFYAEYTSKPSASINYTRNLLFDRKGFFAASGGLKYILGFATITGEPNPGAFQNSGLAIPLQLTYNYSIGHFDQRLISRIRKECIIKPPKFNMEWFLEAGGGFAPFFHNKNSILTNGINFNGYGGLRTQLMIRRPYHKEDLVIFARGGFLPNYTFLYPPFKDTGFRTDLSASVGFGF